MLCVLFPALAPCDGTSLAAAESSGAVYLLRSRVETGHTSVDDTPTKRSSSRGSRALTADHLRVHCVVSSTHRRPPAVVAALTVAKVVLSPALVVLQSVGAEDGEEMADAVFAIVCSIGWPVARRVWPASREIMFCTRDTISFGLDLDTCINRVHKVHVYELIMLL